MRRKTILIGLCLMLLSMPAIAHESDTTGGVVTIGGMGLGFVVDASNEYEGAVTTQYFAGVRAKKFSETASLYAVYQHLGIEESDVGGNGARFIYVEETFFWSRLSTLVGVGFMSDVAENADSSRTTGITADGGFALSLGKTVDFIAYGYAVDMGQDFSFSLNAALSIRNPQDLFTGIF